MSKLLWTKLAVVVLMVILMCGGLVLSTGAKDQSPSTRAGPTAVPTFHSLGLYWSPAQGSASNICDVQYRINGTIEWSDGFSLWFDTRNSEYRGSLVHLESGTNYDIELELRSSGTKVALNATTWNETFPIAQTVIVSDRSTPLMITQSGTPDGYILYTNAQGSTATIDVADNHDNCVNIDASYIIVRNLILKGASIDAIKIEPGNNDIVIERNDISGWGRVHTDGWGYNELDSAVRAGEWSAFDPITRIIAQRNVIHHPRSDSNNWDEYRSTWDTYHPIGAQAISMVNTDGNHVFRYNTVFSDEDHYFNDIFGGGSNFGDKGFPNCDSDIYGNSLQHCWDDGIESEGANRNVRIWGNYINGTYVKIAVAATEVGPIYIWRNICDRAQRNHTLSDDSHGSFIKAVSKEYGGPFWGDGKIYIFHNTLLQDPPEAGLSYPMGCSGGIIDTGNSTQTITEVYSRNNILHIHKPWWDSIREDPVNETNSFDYDLFNGDYNNMATPPAGIEDNGIKGTPTYDPSNGEGEFYLSTGTNGHNDGQVLYNFNDGYEGAAPDMGAHERGADPFEFGDDAYLWPLTITTEDDTTVYWGENYTVDYDAVSDPSNTYFEWELTEGPAFLSIDNGTGVLGGSPEEGDVGQHFVRVNVSDEWGRTDFAAFFLDVLGNSPPSVSLKIGQPKYYADVIYVNSSSQFNISSYDNTPGLDGVSFKYNDTDWMEYEGNFTLPSSITQVHYMALDRTGLSTTGYENVSVDNEAPTTIMNVGENTGVSGIVEATTKDQVQLVAQDGGSGIGSTLYSIDGGTWLNYFGNITFNEPGTYIIEYYSFDNLLQEETIRSVELHVYKGITISGSVTYGDYPFTDGDDVIPDGENVENGTVELMVENGSSYDVIMSTLTVNGSFQLTFPVKGLNYSLRVTPPEEHRIDEVAMVDGYLDHYLDPLNVTKDSFYFIELEYYYLQPFDPSLCGFITYDGGHLDGMNASGVMVEAYNSSGTLSWSDTSRSDGFFSLLLEADVNYTIIATPQTDKLGEANVSSGYLPSIVKLDVLESMEINFELRYYNHSSGGTGNGSNGTGGTINNSNGSGGSITPFIQILSPYEDQKFQTRVMIEIQGTSNLPEGSVITVMFSSWTGLVFVDAWGNWNASVMGPSHEAVYTISVQNGSAYDQIIIEVVAPEPEEESSGLALYFGILAGFLIVVLIILVVLVMMMKMRPPGEQTQTTDAEIAAAADAIEDPPDETPDEPEEPDIVDETSSWKDADSPGWEDGDDGGWESNDEDWAGEEETFDIPEPEESPELEDTPDEDYSEEEYL